MSQDDLHQVAQVDTPNGVEVPNTPQGLALWLLGRFGVAVVFAASTFYVYQDMRADRAELFRAYQENIRVISEFKAILENQAREIQRMNDRPN
jgi:hypothetical protein